MKRFFLGAYAALALTASAQAATITYEIQNGGFVVEDEVPIGASFTPIPGQITGTFDYDTDLNEVTRIALQVSGLTDQRLNGLFNTVDRSSGSLLSAVTRPLAVGAPVFGFAPDGSFEDGLPLSLVNDDDGLSALASLGVTVSITTIGRNPFQSRRVPIVRDDIGITGTAVPVIPAVPVPLSAGLLLAGLAGLRLMRRKAG
ncbi:MAG: hypothetical protein AAGF27_04375 [Pseudomonadota bacterium]